jgi:hypothetical protein
MEYQPFIVSNITYLGHDTGPGDESSLGFTEDKRPVNLVGCMIDGSNGSWGLKFKGNKDVHVYECRVFNGTAATMDVEGGSHYQFRKTSFEDKGYRKIKPKKFWRRQSDVCLRSGASFLVFDECKMNDVLVGTIEDILLGKPMVSDVFIDKCTSFDGEKIDVRVLHGKNIVAPNCNVIYYNKYLVKAYCLWFRAKTFIKSRITKKK